MYPLLTICLLWYELRTDWRQGKNGPLCLDNLLHKHTNTQPKCQLCPFCNLHIERGRHLTHRMCHNINCLDAPHNVAQIQVFTMLIYLLCDLEGNTNWQLVFSITLIQARTRMCRYAWILSWNGTHTHTHTVKMLLYHGQMLLYLSICNLEGNANWKFENSLVLLLNCLLCSKYPLMTFLLLIGKSWILWMHLRGVYGFQIKSK